MPTESVEIKNIGNRSLGEDKEPQRPSDTVRECVTGHIGGDPAIIAVVLWAHNYTHYMEIHMQGYIHTLSLSHTHTLRVSYASCLFAPSPG